MARNVSITSPSDQTDSIIKEIKELEGLLELQVFRNVSVKPPGDLIKAAVPNSSLQELMRRLDQHQLGQENGISVSTSEPDSLVPTNSSYEIERDINEGSWEEMEMTIANDSNTSINTLLTMFIAGSLATIGVTNNTLHIVIGGMLVAPGFMPITRIALGLIGKHPAWHYGIYDFLKGYLALILGAVVSSLILKSLGTTILEGSSSYYTTEQDLIRYWTTVTKSSLIASAFGSIAGALLVATKKSVFTSGVMIALALVPTAAIVGMGFVGGDYALAGRAFMRFAIDVGLVFIFSLLVFIWTRLYYHKRDTKM